MAERPAWTLEEHVKKENFTFEWNGGFAASQKRKNICNLHTAIGEKYSGRVLEISTKSEQELGKKLSAFNLKLNGSYLENVFQASKVYESGGPYSDLLSLSPKDAKRDVRHQTSGALVGFCYNGDMWALEPKTAFYDYLYVMAAKGTLEIFRLEELKEYQWFTDIEFNPNRSINCQAEGVALLKHIVINGCWDVLEDKAKWQRFHQEMVRG